jgi:Fe2+ transport system protein B
MIEKAKIFVTDAGKVYSFISLLLWFLSKLRAIKPHAINK